MNRERRKEISNVILEIEKVKKMCEEISFRIESIMDDESDYMDNIPENLQSSDRYYDAEEAVDNLESAMSDLGDLDFDAVIDSLREAKR